MNLYECTLKSSGGGGGGGGTGVSLFVTCDSEFAGSTITCTDGSDSYSETCPSSSPYIVEFQGIPSGTWTVVGTASGTTYTKQITIDDINMTFNAVPDGKTKTPTDDVSIWLLCAGITDKTYTTISQVLSDATTLQTLISNNNAVDYMARSTTWASSVCANSNAMTKIGANNYCSDTLLGNSTWLNAIANSSYIDSVLNTKVPTMTSNTTPSGTVSASSVYSGRAAYYAFSGRTPSAADAGSFWASNVQQTANQWLQYEFVNTMKIKYIVCYMLGIETFTAQAEVNNAWVDLIDVSNNTSDSTFYKKTGIVANDIGAKKFRFINKNTVSGYPSIAGAQFYGRVDV